MAIYISESTRRRRLLAIAGICLIAGVVVGGVIGRATTSGVEDSVHEVRALAEDAATALERLPIEYEQALAGEGGESTDTITEALGRARVTLAAAYDEIDVFGPASRSATDAALDEVARAIDDKVAPTTFEGLITAAVTAVHATFGLSPD